MNYGFEICTRHFQLNSLGKWHAGIFAGLLLISTIATYFITSRGIDDGPDNTKYIISTTAGAISGPLTGAISRGLQSCCLEFSLGLLAWCAPALLACVLVQFFRWPRCWWMKPLQGVVWAGGWMVWFAGGILSFSHALG